MTATATVTRQTNENGTYAYSIAELPEFAVNASRVLYTHASVLPVGADDLVVSFHKTEAAARRTGRAVVEIVAA